MVCQEGERETEIDKGALRGGGEVAVEEFDDVDNQSRIFWGKA